MKAVRRLPSYEAVSSAFTPLIAAAQDPKPVGGWTHNFYRYPARFSPRFVRAAILAFSNPGDTVFDPFMGGGTTLVEASVMGRKGVGTDINPLALFVARVKTTPLSEKEIGEIEHWGQDLVCDLKLRNRVARPTAWVWQRYQRNINDRKTWPIRKTLELALTQLGKLRTWKQQQFVRCVLLRSGQWALDCRSTIPSAIQFRERFLAYLEEMAAAGREYTQALTGGSDSDGNCNALTPLCLSRSVVGVEKEKHLASHFPPALILTSPPYPGVHVLYHRWQVQGRRETPAPFWIVGSPDGNGASYYTFGDRKRRGLAPYYDQLLCAYHSLARIANKRTLLVQLVAFSDPSWQLPRCLGVLHEAGFKEIECPSIANSKDGRVWRSVPHRKWYAAASDGGQSSHEVVLFHKLARTHPSLEESKPMRQL